MYPPCPQPVVFNDQVSSLNLGAGMQLDLANESNPATMLGYAGTNPPQNQQCSWVNRLGSHPAFEKFVAVEIPAAAG